MQKTLTFIILAGIVPIVFGCTNSPGEAQLPPSPTQFLVLPIDAHGELKNISSLRSGPGTTFDEIATLPQGAYIQIIGASTDIKWYLIKYTDTQELSIQAWVSAESVTITLQTSSERDQTLTPETIPSLLFDNTLTPLTEIKNTLAVVNTMTYLPTLIIPPTLILTSTISAVTRPPNINPGSTARPPIQQPTLPQPQSTSTRPPIGKPTPPFGLKSSTPTR